MPAITREEVAHVAHLSRLELSSEEEDLFAQQLARILDYVGQLGEVDVGGGEPFFGAPSEENVFRADKVRPGLPVDGALANAPEAADGGFVVPRILDA